MNTQRRLLHNVVDIPRPRRGAVIPLVAVFLVVMLAMAAFSIDVAYMQLVDTQLKAATDAAAKAGTSALVQGKTDAEAVQAAIALAALNNVGGQPLQLDAADIQVGQSQLQGDGSWLFVPGAKPSQAMQISSQLANGGVNLFFAPALGVDMYNTSSTSVASAFATEVCLVLDRSHSMCWNNTGIDYRYPPPVNTNWTLGTQTPPLNGSRWRALDTAVGTFCNILQNANAPPRVAVVTWANTVGKNTTEYALTGQTSPPVTVDLQLTTDMSAVAAAVHARTFNVMLGGTNMAGGMDQGRAVLNGPGVYPYAKKVMILMTDGQWNAGRNPLAAAADAAAENITIHCISFLQNSDPSTMQQIANITGGKFYHATNAASLNAAFEELAYTLPVVLTK